LVWTKGAGQGHTQGKIKDMYTRNMMHIGKIQKTGNNRKHEAYKKQEAYRKH
jgi:hypothetical protein